MYCIILISIVYKLENDSLKFRQDYPYNFFLEFRLILILLNLFILIKGYFNKCLILFL